MEVPGRPHLVLGPRWPRPPDCLRSDTLRSEYRRAAEPRQERRGRLLLRRTGAWVQPENRSMKRKLETRPSPAYHPPRGEARRGEGGPSKLRPGRPIFRPIHAGGLLDELSLDRALEPKVPFFLLRR